MTPIFKAYVFASIEGCDFPLGVVEDQGGRIYFGYARSWLSRPDAYSIDPKHLPLTQEIMSVTRFPDVLKDAGPDNWGRRVLTATHTTVPRNEIEWLLAGRGTGAGNLIFSTSRNRALPTPDAPSFADLRDMLEGVDQVERHEVLADPRVAKLMDYGSSMGGARPKVVIRHKDVEWIAKLNRRDDTFDQVKSEYACLEMARSIGIATPDTELHTISGRSVLLVKRFDRDELGGRLHYISGQTVLGSLLGDVVKGKPRIQADDFAKDYSYAGLASALRRYVNDTRLESSQIFTRMLLNVAIGNTDDHLRNHGLLLDPRSPGKGFSLSPVFDILPHEGAREHAIGVGPQGRASTWENALSSYRRFGLDASDAKDCFERVNSAVADMESFLDRADMPSADKRYVMSLTAQPLRSEQTQQLLISPTR